MKEKIDLKAVAEAALAEDEVSSAQECVFDAGIFTMSLEEHDRRYHGGCYKPGSYCAYRDWLRKYEGVDQLLSKGSLGELRQRLHDLDSDIRKMREANSLIIGKARYEMIVLSQKEEKSGLSPEEIEKKETLRADIFRRLDMDEYIPAIATARLFACEKTGGRFRLGVGKDIGKGAIDALKLIVRDLFAASVVPEKPINLQAVKEISRAESTNSGIRTPLTVEMPTLIHEYAHLIERSNPKILAKTTAFLDYRCHGEKSMRLSKLTGMEYQDSEMARPDKFFNPYCGKDYFNKEGKREATEILSMGLERILTEPSKFLEEDPEYFKLCINIARGE